MVVMEQLVANWVSVLSIPVQAFSLNNLLLCQGESTNINISLKSNPFIIQPLALFDGQLVVTIYRFE